MLILFGKKTHSIPISPETIAYQVNGNSIKCFFRAKTLIDLGLALLKYS